MHTCLLLLFSLALPNGRGDTVQRSGRGAVRGLTQLAQFKVLTEGPGCRPHPYSPPLASGLKAAQGLQGRHSTESVLGPPFQELGMC